VNSVVDGLDENDEALGLFRETVSRFFERHAPEDAVARWREAGVVDRSLWRAAGQAGLLAPSMPEEYGGAGADFRYEAAVLEELARRGLEGFGISVHSAIAAPYILELGDEAQKARWLPGVVSGEVVLALAMSEPAAGSDLRGMQCRAVRDGGDYVINGQKTFISNGQTADLVVLACKTEGDVISLLLVETEATPGFSRGRNLKKMGREAQDTSELFFADARVPAANLLGGAPGQGFAQMARFLVQERLTLSIMCQAVMERALRLTTDYVRERRAFGRPLFEFQNTRFKLAEAAAQIAAGRAFVDSAVDRHLRGALDAVEAAKLKLWVTETQCKVVDDCLQLFGGYGYMDEYPISRIFRDARIDRIHGGTSEIMKTIIARSL
jgi:acyl-CoA dehydrogenase